VNRLLTRRLGCVLVLLCATLLLAARYTLLVDRYAVNVLFADQWDFFTPLFQGADEWTLFSWRHGPHRQGLGFLLSAWLNRATGWNTIYESYYILSVLFAACGAALWLACRLRGRLTLLDLFIPCLLLSPLSGETILVTPNASHSIFPLFLLVLSALVCTAHSAWFVQVALALLGMMLLFTGFGMIGFPFVVLCALGLIVHDMRRKRFRLAGVGIASAAFLVASLLLFLTDYRPDPAHADFRLDQTSPWGCIRFAALMFAFLFQVGGVRDPSLLAHLFGFCWLLALAILTAWSAAALFRAQRSNPRVRVVFLFCGTALAYAFATAVGRLSVTGVTGGMTSRYTALLMPGPLGLYFFLDGLERPRLRTVSLAFCLAAALMALPSAWDYSRFHARHFARMKRVWVETYLSTGDIEAARRRSRGWVYPFYTRDHNIEDRLEFLRKHELNLFLPRQKPHED